MHKDKKEYAVFRTMAAFVRPYGHFLYGLVILSIVGALVDLVIVYFIRELIDMTISKNFGNVLSFVFYISLVIILGIFTKFRVKRLMMIFGAYIARDIQLNAYHHISKMAISSLEQFDSGDVVSKFSNGIFVIQSFLQNDFYFLIYYPIIISGTLIFMIIINWKLVLFSSILTPFMIFLSGLLSAPITRYTGEIQRHMSEANSFVRDSVTGAATAKAYHLNEVLLEKYKHIMDKLLDKSIAMERLRSLLAPSVVILRLAPFLLCLLYGGYLMVQGNLELSSFIAFFPLLNSMLQPISAIPYYINSIRSVTGAAEHIFEIWDQPGERQDGEKFSLKDKAVMLEFDAVSFRYDDQRNILDNISFQVKKGQTTAIVGLSGGGKSTILKLVCGFYEPEKGCIRLGEVEYKKWSLTKVRESIALVSQNNDMFPDSIASNISCGKQGVTREDIIMAATEADAHDFIMELTDGYDTQLGESGAGLSGGQRQRIAIARAFLKDTKLLLFDEPTAALDAQAEALIHDSLRKLKGKYAVLIVTHHFATAKLADEIIVLDQGRIVERGAHDQLLEKNGVYKTLYHNQMDSPQ